MFKKTSSFSLLTWLGGIMGGAGLYWGVTEYFSDTRDSFINKFGHYFVGLSEGAFIGTVAVITAIIIASKFTGFSKNKSKTQKIHVSEDIKKNEEITNHITLDDVYSSQISRIKRDIDNLLDERSKYLTQYVGSDRQIDIINKRIEELRKELQNVESERSQHHN